MSLVGSPFGNCWKPSSYPKPTTPKKEEAPEPETVGAGAGDLNLKKYLGQKGKELVADGTLEDAKPATVLQEYYRETVSEGSGQYDEPALRKFGSMIRVKPADVEWFEKQVGPLSDDFASTVYSVVLQDAMQAMCGDPAVAVALCASVRK